MKILKIAFIPLRNNIQNNISHFETSDPIDIWVWNGGQGFEKKDPVASTPYWDLTNDEDSELYGTIFGNYSELTILTDKSKEIFSLSKITSTGGGGDTTWNTLEYSNKSLHLNYSLKKVIQLQGFLKESLEFCKNTMRNIIYENPEELDLDEESIVREALENYLMEIDKVIKSKEREIKENLNEYNL
jgi:hypothetical protein